MIIVKSMDTSVHDELFQKMDEEVLARKPDARAGPRGR